MAHFVSSSIDFVRQHEGWGAALVFALAFCESFAFISLIVPATWILFGVGGVIVVHQLKFWPIWIAATLGAFAGDWLAYELTVLLRGHVERMPAFASRGELVARGVKLFDRWGMFAVFIGRFFGPLRAVVPIVAGMYRMPRLKFQVANIASAVLWAFGVLVPGFAGMRFWLG